ncbi:SDR family NAD(P)-dependent oxidoreductase [Desulfovibrio ferrophilus]|uniref:Short-chain dehydrogenase/reductase SDR n=1 Tax=Desulfovibrio ferrophilus TaxID=241368 RepID=A0A2Z6B3I2_9BACT|nr:SDR family NAD(P)-dependent oxidoreductase [Desulfovibrio ferrophilus]BBD10067.1 short-chain dehydrogenase/reductase SDR [Desulfovibrio ferrophilus]
MSLLANKTLIVTGASSGVGQALAVQLARAGASLVLNARRKEPLRQTLTDCANASAKAGHDRQHVCVAGSAGQADIANVLATEALNLGHFHGFIHAAGVLAPGPSLWELPEDDFDKVFEAGPLAAHRLIRTCVPHLLAEGQGLAVFMGSGAAQIAQPGIAAYCAAKAALEHTMRQLAAEAPALTTFVYRPGIVDTPMQTQARHSKGSGAPQLKAIFNAWKKNGELLSPEDSAAALTAILDNEPHSFHGRIATVEHGRMILAESTGVNG